MYRVTGKIHSNEAIGTKLCAVVNNNTAGYALVDVYSGLKTWLDAGLVNLVLRKFNHKNTLLDPLCSLHQYRNAQNKC